MNARLTLFGLLGLISGCFNLPDEKEAARFACSTNADCLDGYRCVGGKCVSETASDTTPPSPPSQVTLSGTAQNIALTWVNPTADFAGVMVVRKLNSAPTSRTDGTEMTETNATAWTDTQVTAGARYCYVLYAYDLAHNYSTGVTAGCFTVPSPSATAPVTGFTATAGALSIKLAWTNPTSASFSGVSVRRAMSSIAPQSPTEGAEGYRGSGTTWTDTGLTAGQVYCYAAFAYDTSGLYAAGATACATPTTTPSTVTGLAATAASGAVTLAWANPASSVVSVRRRQDNPPSTMTDGVEVYHNTGSGHVDSGLTDGTLYCYSAFTLDALGGASAPASVCAQPRLVGAMSPWAARWNEWGSNTSAVACDASTAYTQQRTCFHGGPRRMFALPASVTSCAGITASDALGAFTWYCNADQVPLQIRSSGLQPGKGLIDLVDRSVPAWRKNFVTVMNGTVVALTTNPEVWWDNPVKAATAGDLLTSGTIHVLTPAAGDIGVPSGAAIIPAINAGAFTGASSATSPIITVAAPFTWIEGFTLQTASASKITLLYTHAAVGVARSISVSGGDGVFLSDSAGLRLRGIDSTGSYRAVALQSSPYNVIEDVVGANTGFATLAMSSSVGNVFKNIRAFNGAAHGVQLIDSSANVMDTVTIASNYGIGLVVPSSTATSSNLFLNVTSISNGTGVSMAAGADGNTFFNLVTQSLLLDGSRGTTLSDAWINSATLNNTSANNFIGSIVVPSAAFCSLSGTNTNPGLDASCSSTSTGATMVVGPTVSASFKREVSADTHQTSASPTFGSVTSWTQFDNPFRVWGRDFASTGYTVWPAPGQTLTCSAGQTCHVWDFSLVAADTALLGRGTKTPTYTHTWSNYATATACAAMPRAVWANNTCSSTFNPDGVERDLWDGLCGTGENCIRSPNLGAYQGSGTLVVDSGTGSITYWKWSVNGEP